MRRKVRLLRHWKQRFHKDAEFIWRRPLVYAGKSCAPGELIPDVLKVNASKLRRFWESGVIELAQFEDPDVLTGRVAQSTPAEDMMRELARLQTTDMMRELARLQAMAKDDFAEVEEEDEAEDEAEVEDEDWLDRGPAELESET